MRVGRSPDQSENSNGEEQGLLNKAWKVKTRTRQEGSLRKRWEQKGECVYRCCGLTSASD